MARMQQPQRPRSPTPGACSQTISPRTPRTGSAAWPGPDAADVEDGVEAAARVDATPGAHRCHRMIPAPAHAAARSACQRRHRLHRVDLPFAVQQPGVAGAAAPVRARPVRSASAVGAGRAAPACGAAAGRAAAAPRRGRCGARAAGCRDCAKCGRAGSCRDDRRATARSSASPVRRPRLGRCRARPAGSACRRRSSRRPAGRRSRLRARRPGRRPLTRWPARASRQASSRPSSPAPAMPMRQRRHGSAPCEAAVGLRRRLDRDVELAAGRP